MSHNILTDAELMLVTRLLAHHTPCNATNPLGRLALKLLDHAYDQGKSVEAEKPLKLTMATLCLSPGRVAFEAHGQGEGK